MSEIADFEAFHPRAVKLLRKQKNFIAIAEDKPYFMEAYRMIRSHEIMKRTWTEEDERIFQSAQQGVQRTADNVRFYNGYWVAGPFTATINIQKRRR